MVDWPQVFIFHNTLQRDKGIQTSHYCLQLIKVLEAQGVDKEHWLNLLNDKDIACNDFERQVTYIINTFPDICLDEFKVDLWTEFQDIATLFNCKKELIMVTSVEDYKINVLNFWKVNPFFYDQSGRFWVWNYKSYCYQPEDEVGLFNRLESTLALFNHTVFKKTKEIYLETMKRIGREKKPLDPPVEWVQFRSQVYNIKTGEIFKVTSDYFFSNSIPYEIPRDLNCSKLDQLFKEWMGDDDINLYEILSYCMLRDYPIHVIIVIYGSGRNGKSKFCTVLRKVLGKHNCVSCDLNKLTKNNFSTYSLYKKLVCFVPEAEHGILDSTTKLKDLTGQDEIMFEAKHKDSFTAENYAKIIIIGNSFPITTDETDGFYRRIFPLVFKNEFEEGKDILADIPNEEYAALAFKCACLLPTILSKGSFTNTKSIGDRKQVYLSISNPFPQFMEAFCNVGDEFYFRYSHLFTLYKHYLRSRKRRTVGHREFRKVLDEAGLFVERGSKKDLSKEDEWVNTNWVLGIDVWANKADIHSLNIILPIRRNNNLEYVINPNSPKIQEEVVEDSILLKEK